MFRVGTDGQMGRDSKRDNWDDSSHEVYLKVMKVFTSVMRVVVLCV